MEAVAWRFGDFTLLAEQRLLMAEGLPVRIGARAFDILVALVEHAGQFVSRDELITRIWGGRVVEEINLRVQVAALRRTLGEEGRSDPQFIVNVPARGYCFIAPVSRSREALSTRVALGATTHVPALLTALVGRDSIVSEICGELQAFRVVTIAGPGGIGKSAVALKVAEATASRHSKGVCHVDLGGLVDAPLALARIAQALGYSSGSPETTESVVGSLHEWQILLLLDGCEGVLDQVATLAEEIVTRTAFVHLLVTSQEPMRIPGEQVHRLGPLAVPPRGALTSLDSALSFASVQLLHERVRAASANFEPLTEEVQDMMEICRRLDGVPLAIELAAHRVEHVGLRGLLGQLDAGFDMLVNERRLVSPIQQSLRASFNWSFSNLTPDEQRILCRLSIFARAFSLASAAQLVSEAGALSEVAARELIGQLVTKSLVSADVEACGIQYRLLGAAREYARTRLHTQGDQTNLRRKHAVLTVGLLEAAEADQCIQSTPGGYVRHASILDEVRAALDWLSGQPDDGDLELRLLTASVQLWFQLSEIAEFCTRADEILGRLPHQVDESGLARVKAALGHARLHVFGPCADSLSASRHATAIAERIGNDSDQLTAVWGLWLDRSLSGQYAEALVLAEKHEALAESMADGAGIASDRMLLVSLMNMGRLVEARLRGERAMASFLLMPVTVASTRPQLELEAIARASLARLLWIQGMPDRSLALARDAVDVARRSMHDLTTCLCLHSLCIVSIWTGLRDEASRVAQELSELATRHGLRLWEAWGRFDRDVIAFLDGHSMRPDWREPACSVRQFELMATFSTDLLEPEMVLRAGAGQAPWCEPEVLRAQGWQTARLGTRQGRRQALTLFDRALQLARAQGALSWELRAATSIAAISDQPEQASMAIDVLTATLAKFTEGLATRDLQHARELLEKVCST